MILKPALDKDLVLYVPETSSEATKMEKFPGLLRSSGVFFSPAKQHIVSNLINRLRDQKITIKCSNTLTPLISDEIELKKLPEDFSFFTKPLPHQELSLRICYTFGNAGLLLAPGLGKTKVIYDLIKLQKYNKSLVVCPKPLLFVWKEEVLKHRPELSVYVIQSTDWEKERAGVESNQVVVINYDKCVSFKDRLSSLKFDFMAVDEGLIKNLHTERTKAIFEISASNKNMHKVVMSGTLVNNSTLDIFSPLKLLEPSLLGTSITRFKNHFCIPAKFNKNVILGFRHEDQARSALQACCVVMTKEEWLKDLPGKKFHHLECNLTDEQREVYNSLASNWISFLPGTDKCVEIEVDNPLPLLSKLNQIANGFIYLSAATADENVPGLEVSKKIAKKVKREIFEFDKNPKIAKLETLLGPQGLLEGRRSIIWFNMSHELTMLKACLERLGYPHLVVAGGEKHIGAIVQEFNSNRNIPYLLCQAKTINYGVTIMGHSSDEGAEEDNEVVPAFSSEVSDEIFFSIGFSLELFLQQQDRIHRIGQTKECNYWILVTNSSVERKVVTRLEEKLECNRRILTDLAKSASIE